MNNDLITPVEVVIKDKKKTIKGDISRAALYARSKVVAVDISENETYYLIYYQNQLIFGDRLDRIEDASFIAKAFQEGLVLESPHPLLTAFLPKRTVLIPNRSKLFSQLQTAFSPLDIAYIATTLDSFLTKEQLEKVIEKLFFHYRRNGNFMKSYQVLQILTAFLPDSEPAHERLHSHDFYTYHDFYQTSDLPVILKKDPLYVELQCFQNRSNPNMRTLLKSLLTTENDLVELLLLWLETGQKDEIEVYTSLALQVVTMPDWLFILTKAGLNPYRLLPEAKQIIEKMMDHASYRTAVQYLLPFMDDLPESYDSVLKRLWDNLDSEFVVHHLDKFLSIIEKEVTAENDEKIEEKVFQLAKNLLQSVDLTTANAELEPLRKFLPHSPMLSKLNHMLELEEDPDNMMELGDCYMEFAQFDQALDCYFWEMELRPQDPEPVLKICRCYQKKGMIGEAENYQKIFTQLKSNQMDGYTA